MKDSAHIAYAVSAVGITCTTLGHYAEWWISGYFVAVFAALIANIVFMPE